MGGLIQYLLGKAGPLTKPGVFDPTTGQVSFDSPGGDATALHQAVADTQAPTMTQNLPTQIPQYDDSGNQPADNSPVSFTPSGPDTRANIHVVDPSFAQRTVDQYGNVTRGASPGLTKMGLLAKALNGAIQGTMDAAASGALDAQRGKSYFGAGAAGAQEMPLVRAMRAQQQAQGQAQTQLLQNQAQAYGIPVQVQGADGQVHTVPLGLAGQYQGLAKTQSEIGKNTAEGQKATAEAGAVPVKMQLDQAQALAANFKEDPNLGLVDVRTGQPLNNAALAPVNEQQAAILGVQPGQRMPIKLVNTADEIANRGIRPVQANGRSLLVDNKGNTIKDMGASTPVVVNNLNNGPNGGRIGYTQGSTGQAALDSMDPGHAALVKAIGDGQMDFATATSRMPPAARESLASAVLAYNPNYDQNLFHVRGAVEKDYTSGASANTLSAYNTALAHLPIFIEHAKALDNGDVRAFNQLHQWWNTQFGSDQPGNFNIAKEAFASEVGKALAGAGVVEGDRTRVQQGIDRASSFAQLVGPAKTAQELLEGKRKVMQQRYQQGMSGKPDFGSGNNGGGRDAFSQKVNAAGGFVLK